MDDEQRKYFATLMASMEGVASDARSAASTSRETAATVRKLDGRVGALEGHVTVLHTHVFGKPPTSEPPAPMRPIAESINEHDGDIATITGQIIATRAELATLHEKQDAQTKLITSFAKHPRVRQIGAALASLLLVGIGYATMRIQSAVSKIEEKPATVQPAPTVYVPVFVDGGAK